MWSVHTGKCSLALKRRDILTPDNMYNLWGLSAKWGTKGCVLCDVRHPGESDSQNQKVDGGCGGSGEWGAVEWRESLCFVGWRNRCGVGWGDGRTASWVHFMLLSSALRNGQAGTFCVYITTVKNHLGRRGRHSWEGLLGEEERWGVGFSWRRRV